MTEPPLVSWLLVATVALPGAAFVALSAGWLLGWEPGEKTVSRITAFAFATASLAAAALAATLTAAGQASLSVNLGEWFVVHDYRFPLMLLVDRLSLPLVLLTTVLVGLVGAFSRRYLHRERGYRRFFVLLNLFGFGSLLIFAAGSYELLVAGWELAGISSVLLIAFFHERPEPVRGALRVFGIYRATDAGLFVGVFVLHHALGSTVFREIFVGEWPRQSGVFEHGAGAAAAGCLLLLAAAGKSAQVPFSGWLPRAMEGPTPSSAVFYGAISVHAGAYLALRSAPVLEAAPAAAVAVVIVGLLTAAVGALGGRASADAKTALAQAALAQVGVIFVEIGLGFHRLALLHLLGHAVVRTLQFLRAPSTLHDFHQMYAAAEGRLDTSAASPEALLPPKLHIRLYGFAFDRGRMDFFLDRCLLAPLMALARALAAFDRLWAPGCSPGPGGALAQRVGRRGAAIPEPAVERSHV